jgi:hypothetical protein
MAMFNSYVKLPEGNCPTSNEPLVVTTSTVSWFIPGIFSGEAIGVSYIAMEITMFDLFNRDLSWN